MDDNTMITIIVSVCFGGVFLAVIVVEICNFLRWKGRK